MSNYNENISHLTNITKYPLLYENLKTMLSHKIKIFYDY